MRIKIQDVPGQVVVAVKYRGEEFPDLAPMGPRGAESLLRASALARDYSQSYGVESATVVLAPSTPEAYDDEEVTIFINGSVYERPVGTDYSGI